MPSSTKPAGQTPAIQIPPQELTLVVWPLRQRPLESLVVIGLAAAASVFVGWWTRQPLVGGALAAALAVTLWRTWLPVTFEVGMLGVTQTVLGRSRRIPWSAVRSHAIIGEGVLLSPDEQLTPLSSLRGLYLPWQDQREKVLASVDYYLRDPAA